MPPLMEQVVLQPLIGIGEARATDRNRRPDRESYARITDTIDVPNLIETQLDSFKWFQDVGLRELFDEISPIEDFTGKNLALSFLDYRFEPPRYDQFECRERDLTYSAPLKVRARLVSALEQPEGKFAGELAALFGGHRAAHCCRHPRSRSRPRRIQLFIVPRGTPSRSASSG